MPISFTDKFSVDKSEFAATGAFDVILDTDSRLFIDPKLLDICDVPEFNNCRTKVEKYFSGIITLLNSSKRQGDMFWKQADKKLTFKEMQGTCFGYSNNSTSGNAIGKTLRESILESISELIEAGEKDPTIFELIGVFQEGIGCDRISDLITYILQPEIFKFTQRILMQFNLNRTSVIYKNIEYRTRKNEYNGKNILLIPEVILSPLPIANDFDEIDLICIENERVRNEIDTYIDFKNKKKLSKSEMFTLIKNNPNFRKNLLQIYKNMNVKPYNFKEDPEGEYNWYNVSKEFVSKYPLQLHLSSEATAEELSELVKRICEQYKHLIEDNGLWELLYDDKGKPKKERAAQLLFYGIAHEYCASNNIDLSREVNNGQGPVDFKLSRGYKEKVLVEVKLTSNPQLKHGFLIQLPIYMKQEETKEAIYLVIYNGHEKSLNNFQDLYNEQSTEVKNKIKLITIDANPKLSASKA